MKVIFQPPTIPEEEKSPLVIQLLAFIEQQGVLIEQQAEQIQQLKDEIARLKNTPRLKIVDQYIRALFRDELPDGIKYHTADHTLHSTNGVVAAANRIAMSENISEHDRELLITAAYFHDTGYIREYDKNEPIAARMAGRILKLIGYKPNEIEKVQKMILATDLEVEPKTHILLQGGIDGCTVSKPLSTGSHFFRNFSNHHPSV